MEIALNNFRGVKSRYDYSLNFLQNYLSHKMKRRGFEVVNTNYDLDLEPEKLEKEFYNVVTAFEILEHLIEPAQVLKRLSGKLLASVPLTVWFSSPHWTTAPYEQHYQEFHPQQFDKLLRYCGWVIVEKKKVRIVKRFGIRQILSLIFPRYYFVY